MKGMTMHDTARVFSKLPRAFVEEGRPQTEEDVALLPWNERRYLQERLAGELRLWRPGAKSRSFESGNVFCVRLCPAIPSYTQLEIATMDPAGVPRFLGGRDESGLFTEGLLRRVYVIDNFGFDRKVSFIPSVPYVPAQYEKYSSPSGNPYAILTTTLWQRTWFPIRLRWRWANIP